jgi:hypothetical protein
MILFQFRIISQLHFWPYTKSTHFSCSHSKRKVILTDSQFIYSPFMLVVSIWCKSKKGVRCFFPDLSVAFLHLKAVTSCLMLWCLLNACAENCEGLVQMISSLVLVSSMMSFVIIGKVIWAWANVSVDPRLWQWLGNPEVQSQPGKTNS